MKFKNGGGKKDNIGHIAIFYCKWQKFLKTSHLKIDNSHSNKRYTQEICCNSKGMKNVQNWILIQKLQFRKPSSGNKSYFSRTKTILKSSYGRFRKKKAKRTLSAWIVALSSKWQNSGYET